jgi:hypothetical protein
MTRSRGIRSERSDYRFDRNAQIAKRVREGETLQAIGNDYGLTRERIRQISLKKNGVTKMVLNRERNAKKAIDRINAEASVAMEIAIYNNLRCELCGAWNIRAGRSAFKRDGVTTYDLCSTECSKRYLILRYRVHRGTNDQHQATSILRRNNGFSKSQIKHAKRIKAGTAGKHPEKYYVREGGKAAEAVEYARRQRRVLGTEHLFNDDISTVETKPVKN